MPEPEPYRADGPPCPTCGRPMMDRGHNSSTPGIFYLCQECWLHYRIDEATRRPTSHDPGEPSWQEHPPPAVRVFFLTPDGKRRYVLQFRGRTDDIYWGAPGKSERVDADITPNQDGIGIRIGDKFGEPVNTKFSYHETGEVHTKHQGELDGKRIFTTPPADLTEPLFAGLYVTKLPKLYEPYHRQIKDGPAALLTVDERQACLRAQLEIFFTPPGKHDLPYRGLPPRRPVPARLPPSLSQTVTSRLLVVIRVTWMTGGLEAFHPDKGIFIIPN